MTLLGSGSGQIFPRLDGSGPIGTLEPQGTTTPTGSVEVTYDTPIPEQPTRMTPFWSRPGQIFPTLDGSGPLGTLDPQGTTTTPAVPVGTKPNNPISALLGGVASSSGRGSSNIFDLDSVAVNERGTGTYNAIAAKLGHVRLAGLTAAASLGVGLATPALTPESDKATAMPVMAEDARDYSKKRISAEKFCDQIVIHIANADGKGYDQIRREVTEVLMEVLDNGQV